MVSWTHKHRPKRRSDIVGNTDSVNSIIAYLNKFRNPKLRVQLSKNALLLHGPPGIGKTSSVLAIANSLNFDIVIVNASDKRNKKSLQSIRNASLFTSLKEELDNKVVGQILLIDEVDGVSGTADRGGIREIIEIIKTTRVPIILTANDISPQKFQTIRKYCELREFKPPSLEEISVIVKRIAEKENVILSDEVLLKLIEISKNDIRGSINSLQTLASGKNEISIEDLNVLSYREQNVEIREFLTTLFVDANGKKALQQTSLINDVDYSKLLFLLRDVTFHFIPRSDHIQLAKAYNILSKADLALTRAQRQRVWSQLSYFYKLCTIELASVITPSTRLPSFPDWQLQVPAYWITLSRQKKGLNIAAKVGKLYNISKQEAISIYFPYIRFIFNNNPEMAAELALGFQLFDVEPGKKKTRIKWNGEIDYFCKIKTINSKIKKRIRELYPTIQRIHQEEVDPETLMRIKNHVSYDSKKSSNKKLSSNTVKPELSNENITKQGKRKKNSLKRSKKERNLSDFFN